LLDRCARSLQKIEYEIKPAPEITSQELKHEMLCPENAFVGFVMERSFLTLENCPQECIQCEVLRYKVIESMCGRDATLGTLAFALEVGAAAGCCSAEGMWIM
jgi:hypothetical protein